MKNNSTWYAEVKFKINTQAESVTYGFRRDRPRGSERVDSYAPPTQGKLEPNEEDMTVLITNLHGIRGSISFPSLSLDAVNRKLVTQYEYPLEQSVECIKKVLEEAILESSEMTSGDIKENHSKTDRRCPQDNARLHTTRLSLQCLQGYDVHLWSAGSPDLSPVKYLLGRQLSPSQNAGELTTQFQRLRHDLPQEVFVTSH
ncbi:dynamin-2 [Trichonephila clavipes]|nr:dynamin-2 [Trichonephila clavipes]